ncbi:MAG: hypothetical protein GY920_11330 [Aliivibrio sp.]|nr:hypothetical protein [Aliivibrio sp.]
MAKLSKSELENIHKLMSDFNQLKIQLGDTMITQHNLLSKVDELKVQYAEEERLLIDKYGSDAVINIQTGEVTDKSGES